MWNPPPHISQHFTCRIFLTFSCVKLLRWADCCSVSSVNGSTSSSSVLLLLLAFEYLIANLENR